jgi:hypothetical protein
LKILFSSILCTCPNQRNLCNLIVSIQWVFFWQLHTFIYSLISSNFLFYCHIEGLKFFYTLSFQKCSFAFYLSLLVSVYINKSDNIHTSNTCPAVVVSGSHTTSIFCPFSSMTTTFLLGVT